MNMLINCYRAEIFDEYTRRQYLARAPDRNPFGEDDMPNKFVEFDVFTKIRVLVRLSQWTFGNVDRMRERMSDTKDSEQVQWVRALTPDWAGPANEGLCSVLRRLDTIDMGAITLCSMMTGYIAGLIHHYQPLPHLNRNQKQNLRKAEPLPE